MGNSEMALMSAPSSVRSQLPSCCKLAAQAVTREGIVIRDTPRVANAPLVMAGNRRRERTEVAPSRRSTRLSAAPMSSMLPEGLSIEWSGPRQLRSGRIQPSLLAWSAVLAQPCDWPTARTFYFRPSHAAGGDSAPQGYLLWMTMLPPPRASVLWAVMLSSLDIRLS